MGQNVFLESGFDDEDATILTLEAEVSVAIANYIRKTYPNNQAGAARKLRVAQSEISALLNANIARFALPKLLRMARRAGLRMWLDTGDDAQGTVATVCGSLAPRVPVVVHEFESLSADEYFAAEPNGTHELSETMPIATGRARRIASKYN